MKTLSLVIPSYNEVDNLLLLEKKLLKVFKDKENIEIIIVDNGGNTKLKSQVEDTFVIHKYILNKKNYV